MSEPTTTLTEHPVSVLLIDDQALIGEAVRRMLANEPGVVFHFCKEGAKALETAVAVKPTVILQDLVMPDADGLELVKQFRAQEATRETPLIVLSSKEEPKTKADAFAFGANDYLVKLPDKLEVLARIRYHSRGYIALLQRNEAYQRLQASQKALAEDVAEAARYVRSLLPAPLSSGPIRADWRFIPSAQLGGDAFGYHPLDSRHFVVYLLDVCGHGVGPALLSVSVMNALRAQSLPKTDFRHPGQVLEALNRAFPMEQQNNKFFTIWYGVVDREARTLTWSGGGHPPSLLLKPSPSGPPEIVKLESQGPMIGMMDGLEYEVGQCALAERQRLFLYSDGAFEVEKPDRTMWSFDDYLAFLGTVANGEGGLMDPLLQHITALGGKDAFADDVSLVEMDLGWD